ncbi:polyisoprenoid-binding protein [Paraliobacillus quinghaiensis]|uniref:Polyisoprenoid-binding protein n=1 Tax=Paraliobacillus quinghaiensis TaxID=470815 RepID=A0A917TXW3_9BACI|nr:YceI family protein [Paraliobacillus quinghaiensis]GGM43120.1 polyisoprenoid-binding protein [Paraliobacillus quinghaiensis]
MTKTTFKVDPTHTSIDFSVKHMMVSKVKGTFHDFQVQFVADPEDLTTAEIVFDIDVNSIDTRNKDRDNHLRTGDFFEVEKYPNILFKSTDVKKITDDEYEITGDVTIKDVTKQETFKVTFEGQGQDPWGNQVFGFSAEGTLNREEYGLTYNAALETGGVLIGKDINFTIDLEAVKDA